MHSFSFYLFLLSCRWRSVILHFVPARLPREYFHQLELLVTVSISRACRDKSGMLCVWFVTARTSQLSPSSGLPRCSGDCALPRGVYNILGWIPPLEVIHSSPPDVVRGSHLLMQSIQFHMYVFP